MGMRVVESETVYLGDSVVKTKYGNEREISVGGSDYFTIEDLTAAFERVNEYKRRKNLRSLVKYVLKLTDDKTVWTMDDLVAADSLDRGGALVSTNWIQTRYVDPLLDAGVIRFWEDDETYSFVRGWKEKVSSDF